MPRQRFPAKALYHKSMSEIQVIQGVVGKTARRKRWQQGWKGFWRGLLAGSCFWLATVMMFKVVPIPAGVLVGAGVASGLTALLSFFLGSWRRPSLLRTA